MRGKHWCSRSETLIVDPPTHRVDFVDVLRGFALLGIFAANLLIFSGYSDYMTDAQRAALSTAGPDRILHLLELIFVNNKFIGLFSFLFGVSFWLFLDRVNARGLDGTRLFYRRLWWLFVIGAIHGWLLWCFDVLRFYALWGLLLPLFLRTSPKKLLSLALFCAVVGPALIRGLAGPASPNPALDELAFNAFSSGSYAAVVRVNWIYDWYLTISVGQIAYQLAVFGRLLLGLYAARTLVFSDFQSHRSLFRNILVIGGLLGLAGNIIIAGHFLDTVARSGFIFPFLRRLIAEVGYLGLTLAYAAGLALLFETTRWKHRLMILAPVGRMALTCYLLQTLIGLWLFYGFMPGPNLMGKVGPSWLALICLIGYALQLGLAFLWLRRFRFGPAEWLWRSLTYWKRQTLRAEPVSVVVSSHD